MMAKGHYVDKSLSRLQSIVTVNSGKGVTSQQTNKYNMRSLLLKLWQNGHGSLSKKKYMINTILVKKYEYHHVLTGHHSILTLIKA